MSVKYLKVKIKSLAEEAHIIRDEERKAQSNYRHLKGRQGREEAYERHVSTFWGLRNHRTGKVRSEARESLLAYAYIRGQDYRTAEANGDPILEWRWCYEKNIHRPVFGMDLKNIARLASKYGDVQVDATEIEEWILKDLYSAQEEPELEAAE